MDLENISFDEINQTRKNKYFYESNLYEVPQIVKFIEKESSIGVTRGWGKKGIGTDIV